MQEPYPGFADAERNPVVIRTAQATLAKLVDRRGRGFGRGGALVSRQELVLTTRTHKQGPLPLRAAVSILSTTLVLAGGCNDESGGIQSYRVPKETAAPPVRASSPSGPMQWDLPDGWRQLPNPNQMRFATLGAGDGAAQVETAITRLGGPAGGIEANINRWRGQLGLPSVGADEMDRDVHPIRAAGADGIWIDLIGPAQGDDASAAPRMLAAIFPSDTTTWFIKTVGSRAALEPYRDGFIALCESVHFGDGAMAGGPAPPPSGSAGPTGRAGTGGAGNGGVGTGGAGTGGARIGPTWGSLPSGWSVDAAPRAMSVASITVSDGGGEASLTITPLGGAQDLLANVNRWRRQVGLGPVADLTEAPPVAIDIAGSPGQLVDVAGPEQRILGAISVRDGTTWFYKLTGPPDLVAGQREAFERFVRSIRFGGATDA